MALYINHTGKLKEVKEKPFKLEKDIQKVFEANLYDIMGLELVIRRLPPSLLLSTSGTRISV